MKNTRNNVEILRKAYRLWGENHETAYDHWIDMLADDVDFRSLAGGASGMEFTAAHTSRDDVRRYFEGLAEDWEMLHFTVEDFIAQDEKVVMRGHCGWRHRRTGKTLETPKADFFRFWNGKVVEFFEFYDTAAALAAGRQE